MNSPLETVNSAAETWWPYVLHISWQSTLVAAFVLIVVRFGRRIPAVVRSALVLIAFAKFLVPPVLPSPVGVFSQVVYSGQETVAVEPLETAPPRTAPVADSSPESNPAETIAATEASDELPSAGEESETASVATNVPASSDSPATSTVPAATPSGAVVQPRLSLQSWLLLLHGMGTLLVGGWVALTAVRLRRLRRRSEVVDDGGLHEVFTSVARELKIRRTISLRVTQNDIPPMAFGVWRPTVLLPASLLDELNAEELKTICAHELAHHRRRDPLMNFVQAVILVVWWFNPLLWLLNRVAREVREDCCDDLILTRGLTTATVYCQVLMGMAERLADRVRPTSPLACAEQMHPVQARMLRVMDSSLPRAPRLSLRGLAAVLVVAALLLPGMSGLSGGPDKEEESSEPRQASESSPAENARQDLYGDPLPAGALVRLGTIRFRHNIGNTMPGIEFISDNSYVTCEGWGRINFRDVRTGRLDDERRGFDIGDQSPRRFRVLPDGETIATVCIQLDEDRGEHKQRLQFWKEGRLMQTITSSVGLREWADALASTPDGTTIVTGSSDGELKFWDRASGTEILTHKFPKLRVGSLAIAPDGRTLAVSGMNRFGPSSVFVWDWAAGKEPVALDGMERRASDVTFSPDGRLLAIGCEGGVRLWDVESRKTQMRLKAEASRYTPNRMAFTSDGRFLAVPTRSNTVELWNVSTGRIEHTFETGRQRTYSVAISPDDRWLVASGSDTLMMVWDLETRKRVPTPPGHEATVTAIEFTPDGKRIVTAGHDHTIRIWNAETGKQEHRLQHEGTVQKFALSPDGKLIASNSWDDTVRLWELETGRQIYRLFGHNVVNGIGQRAVSFTPDGKQILSWGDNFTLRVWDVDTGKALSEFPTRPPGHTIPGARNGEAEVSELVLLALNGGFFTTDGARLVMSWRDTVSIFDVETGKRLNSFKIDGSPRTMASASGSHLMATSIPAKTVPIKLASGGQAYKTIGNPVLQIRDSETGEIQRTIPLPKSVYWVGPEFSPDDQLAAVVPTDPEVGIPVYDVKSGRLRYHITGFPARPCAAAFSPDGSRLASAHYDTTVLIWDLRDFQVEND